MASLDPRELLAGVLGGIGGTLIVHLERHLPWRLSAIVGLAIGVLVLASLRSVARLRAAWRPARWRRDDDEQPRDGG
jgi:hypothetical protein